TSAQHPPASLCWSLHRPQAGSLGTGDGPHEPSHGVVNPGWARTMQFKRKLMHSMRGLRAYFALAFGISWTAILLLATRTGLPAPANGPAGNRLLVFAAMLAGPSLAGLGRTGPRQGRRRGAG